MKFENSVKYRTLDYKWAVRLYLSEKSIDDQSTREFLETIANSSFAYYDRYRSKLDQDTSLRAITSFCKDPVLMHQVEARDKDVEFLSRLFNQMVHSTRGLHKCYDCGTNARAMFFKLITAHRGKFYISPQEQLKMERQYVPIRGRGMSELKKCYRDIKMVEADTVFICSLGLDGFGHVWIFEKRFINGKVRYHHYQTSFRSHLLIDFIEDMDYGRYPDQSLDIDAFFTDFIDLMCVTDPWEKDHYLTFARLFAFLPTKTVDKPEPSFCYTYLTY